MKRIQLSFFASLVAAAVLTSCGSAEKMKSDAALVKYTATPQVLEMHGGEVEVTVNAQYPQKYFTKNVILTVTPYIEYEGGQKEFKPKVVQGEDVEANNQVISNANGGNFTHTDKIAFEPGMRVSELKLKIEAEFKGQKLPFDAVKIADGVKETPNLVDDKAKAILMTDKFQRIIPESKEADIHYVINQATVRNSELRSEDIKMLKEFIKAAKANERVEIKGAEISAYASPDGELDLNTKLAGRREKSAERYYKKALKRAKVDAKADNFLSLKNTPEDWDGFKELMEGSEIQDKELILRVLSMYSDPVVREKEIKNIAAAYTEIADKILPQLRRSKLIFNVEKIGYSDDELRTLVNDNIDTLNIEELLYAAKLVDDWNKRLAIYEKAFAKYPNSIRAINNIGYAQLELGKMAEAKVSFNKAKELNADNPIVLNNLGAIAMREGDMATAEEYFNAATDAGEVVAANLGVINIKKGDYKTAVTYYKDNVSFNSALAMMLAGQMGAAEKTLNALGEDAMAFYLKAIIGARAQNDDKTLDNLRKAVGMKAELKAAAKTDLEFFKYFENETFKTITE